MSWFEKMCAQIRALGPGPVRLTFKSAPVFDEPGAGKMFYGQTRLVLDDEVDDA